MEVNKQLIIGLPGAGKTTFLAALWHVVESREVPDSLVVSEVHGVRDHLNKIRTEWLNCQELDRTKIPTEKTVSFRLRDPQTARIVELSLPDLSGETFQLQWETRQWTAEFDKLASECSGVLLFVHPNTIMEPQRIDPTLDAMVAALGEQEGISTYGAEGSSSAVTHAGTPAGSASAFPHPTTQTMNTQAVTEPWSPARTPTQVILVEILQFLRARPFLSRPLPLAVVVSAWDLITTGEASSEWVQNRLPLLYQYLRANVETIPSSVFGISAQGDDLSKAKELQQHMRASDRIIVTAVDRNTTHDITAPVKWLLDTVSDGHQG